MTRRDDAGAGDVALVSIIVPTYQRAATLPRMIESVFRQDLAEWELLIVDDGSTDDTPSVLERYRDPRIRVVRHGENRGVAAALNTGLDQMRGRWFTFLGSDDELVPGALSAMLRVPREIDPIVDAVTCNCIDSVTGRLAGLGLDHDQYLDLPTMVAVCRGEHWGITQSRLVGGRRLNEGLPGGEDVFWVRLSRDARRYYLHQGLRIYHTEGSDRITGAARSRDLTHRRALYLGLMREADYLETLKLHAPGEYARVVFNAGALCIIDGDRPHGVWAWHELRAQRSWTRACLLLGGLLLGARWMEGLYLLLISDRLDRLRGLES